MNLPVVYADKKVLSHVSSAEFDLDTSDKNLRAIGKLKLSAGDHIAVVDSSHNYFECEVIQPGKKLRLRIAQHKDAPERTFNLTVVQGICEQAAMDNIFYASTEFGAQRLIPLTCERGVQLDMRRADEYAAHLNDIARDAAMLSGQPSAPLIEKPTNMHDLALGLSSRDGVLICYEQETKTSISEALDLCVQSRQKPKRDLNIAVVVGPAGGFAQHEIDRLLSSNTCAYTVSLGSSILRVETAGIIAPAITAYELGGLH